MKIRSLALLAHRLLAGPHPRGQQAGSRRVRDGAEHRLGLLGDGNVLLSGTTASPDFPTTGGAFQRRLRGKNNGFLTKLSADGRRFVFSTLLGGSTNEYFLMPASGDAAAKVRTRMELGA